MNITKYVAGFMFSADFSEVALIRKNKPAWQAGKLNGIGGKIEEGETSHYAMVREFAEETGAASSDWFHFFTMGDGDSFSVDFFVNCGDVEDLHSMEEEKVEIVSVRDIHPLRDDMIENLPWLIALAIDTKRDIRPMFANVSYPPF